MMEHKETANLSEKLMMLLFLRMRSSDVAKWLFNPTTNCILHTRLYHRVASC